METRRLSGSIAFTLVAPLPLQNAWERMHWAARRSFKIALAWEIRGLLTGQIPARPIEFAEVKIWRHSIREPDQDGMIVKALLDVLQPCSKRHPYGLGIIKDDRPANCHSSIRHVRALHRTDQCTRVAILALGGVEFERRRDEAA